MYEKKASIVPAFIEIPRRAPAHHPAAFFGLGKNRGDGGAKQGREEKKRAHG